MLKLKHPRLTFKISGGFAIVLVLCVAIALIGINVINKALVNVNNADDVNRLIKNIEKARMEEKNYIIRHDTKYVASVLDITKLMEHQLRAILNRLTDDGQKTRLRQIISSIENYKEAFIRYANLYERKLSLDMELANSADSFEDFPLIFEKEEALKLLKEAQKDSILYITTKKLDSGHNALSKLKAIVVLLKDNYAPNALKVIELAKRYSMLLDNSIQLTLELEQAEHNMVGIARIVENGCVNIYGELKDSMFGYMKIAKNLIIYKTFVVVAIGIFISYGATRVIIKHLDTNLHHIVATEKLASIGRLAAGVAHEVNNPITNLSLNVEILKEDLAAITDDDNIRKRIEKMEQDIDRVSTITKELLQFSHPDGERFVEININSIINSVLLLMYNKLKDFTVHLFLAEVPDIYGNPIKLEQVLINVLTNSIEAMKEKKDIYISTFANKDIVSVEVRDTGSGIPEKYLAKVFEAFFTTKEIGIGTGLGLSIAYSIIVRHNGTIDVYSKENKGTTVVIKLPVAQ
ncbi:MAG: ATP-binding protein [Candidatus Magnetoovum sp. WYHC-5]|nr:ATP-binding protein [Candidatus Magnetoovum sp. WYHC-5]